MREAGPDASGGDGHTYLLLMVVKISKNWARALCAVSILAISGCGSRNIGQFADGAPSMAPPNWMAGTVDGYGVIVDRFGNVKSQFHAHEVGAWDAQTQSLTLAEHIVYLQGSTDPPTDRIWHFTEITPGRWNGTASDIIGTARAEQQGNVWHLVFDQDLPINGHQIAVHIDDWRFREAEDVALDISTVSKFGVRLAVSNIAFIKRAD